MTALIIWESLWLIDRTPCQIGLHKVEGSMHRAFHQCHLEGSWRPGAFLSAGKISLKTSLAQRYLCRRYVWLWGVSVKISCGIETRQPRQTLLERYLSDIWTCSVFTVTPRVARTIPSNSFKFAPSHTGDTEWWDPVREESDVTYTYTLFGSYRTSRPHPDPFLTRCL